MADTPQVQYAKSGDIHIAFMSIGNGPEEFLLAPGAVSHVEQRWHDPLQSAWFVGLAAAGRVTWFDKRGTGMSDRDARFTFEERCCVRLKRHGWRGATAADENTWAPWGGRGRVNLGI